MFYKEVDFQETPIGEIPRTWEAVSLGNVILDIADGGTPSTKIKEYFNGDVPWVNIEDIKKNIYNTRRRLSKLGLKHSSAKLWNKGTVIFSFGASIGKAGIAKVDLCTKQGIAGIVPRTDKISTEFLYYILLKNGDKIERIGRSMGSTIREVRPPKLKKLVAFPLPPLGEQKKIVEILSVVDSAIELVDRVIWQTERLKKGLMQELLTKGLGHTEFKETRIGRISKEWDIAKLGEIATIRYGLGQPPESDENGTPMIRATNIKRGVIVETDILRVKRSAIPESRNPFLREGDVIVVRSGAYTGDIGHITRRWEGAIAGYDLVVSPSNRINSVYLAHYLLSLRVQTYFSQLKSRSAQPHLNSEQVSDTPIALPSLSEQRKIADFLSTIDKKLGLERDEKVRLERVKRGLMDLLLTGKVRVKVD